MADSTFDRIVPHVQREAWLNLCLVDCPQCRHAAGRGRGSDSGWPQQLWKKGHSSRSKLSAYLRQASLNRTALRLTRRLPLLVVNHHIVRLHLRAWSAQRHFISQHFKPLELELSDSTGMPLSQQCHVKLKRATARRGA